MEFIKVIIYISIYIGFFTLAFYLLGFLEREQLKKTKNYFASIIIPAFNEENTLEKTVKSALELNYPKDKYEIIIVDDGSTDKTAIIGKALAKKNKNVKYLYKKNGGKGSALNLGIAKSKGELIISLDADSMVTPDALKHMIPYFSDPQVMCVTPAMKVYKPKGILQRIQAIEYDLGIFLRKAFTKINAVHVTPGPFSTYRKIFFEKYGGYDEKNITEDMEIALRIQSNHYKIENSPRAVVYTVSPNKFLALTKQRRRWYFGMIKNLMKYKHLFSKKYGELGILVLPFAIISILSVIIVTTYTITRTINNFSDQINLYSTIGFDFINNFNLQTNLLYLSFYKTITEGIVLFGAFFFVSSVIMLAFINRKIKSDDKTSTVIFNYIPFMLLYAVLFSFWWIVSIIYSIFSREIEW